VAKWVGDLFHRCIIKLGNPGNILGFDIDTAHFNGNEAPQSSVEVLFNSSSSEPEHDDPRWTQVLPVVNLGPSSRHLFTVPEWETASHVKLNMYPDGGIARFRVYGVVRPRYPHNAAEPFDLAHVFSGGTVPYTSDQHFGVGSNLILPGRGKDMGDGWETKRSRQKDHIDWAIIKLGVAGRLEFAEIDTAHFKGNFPESCELHATDSDVVARDQKNVQWTPVLSRTKLGPHRRHFFQLENVQDRIYSHVKLTIYPDGGVKRVRIIGHRVDTADALRAAFLAASDEVVPAILTPKVRSMQRRPTFIPVLPLTADAFEGFGQVIQAYADSSAAPRGTKITAANGATAKKFHRLALINHSYWAGANALTGLSAYRSQPVKDVAGDKTWEITTLERHAFTNQAFIPMGCSEMGGDDGLENPGSWYLVVVAKNGADDKPDLTTLRAFMATAAQGIMYDTAVWHQPMTVFDRPMDFTCVETQIGDGGKADCEIVELDNSKGAYKLVLPTL